MGRVKQVCHYWGFKRSKEVAELASCLGWNVSLTTLGNLRSVQCQADFVLSSSDLRSWRNYLTNDADPCGIVPLPASRDEWRNWSLRSWAVRSRAYAGRAYSTLNEVRPWSCQWNMCSARLTSNTMHFARPEYVGNSIYSSVIREMVGRRPITKPAQSRQIRRNAPKSGSVFSYYQSR